MRLPKTLVSLALVTASTGSAAQQDMAAHWRSVTAMDVEAAHRMILEDHPGAAREVGDAQFQRALADGYAEAKSRAAQVTSFEGYVATLAGLSVSLGDKHIWSRPLYSVDRPEWPGLIVARRGGAFVVAAESDAVEGPPLSGAKLLSCDSVPVEQLADQRLAEFRVVRGIEAQLIQRAAFLLLDEGNPFLTRPQSCEFSQDGQTRSVPLKWRPLWRHDFMARAAASPTRGAAGFGVRKTGNGYWIAIQAFSERAVPVVEEVRGKAEELKRAPYLVVDLRGNGGGNSTFGRQIAEALLGADYLSATFGGSRVRSEGCTKAWRVSDRNVRQVEYYKNELGPQQGPEAARSFIAEYELVAAAKAAGKPFTKKVSCSAGSAKAASRPHTTKPTYAGRLILLTDNVCFSSCLMVTDDFRKLGALHVGETTDANTHYMEVREDQLPSGLSMFSTLQAIGPSMPRQLGPFTPTILYEGSIADTAGLEKWVESVALKP